MFALKSFGSTLTVEIYGKAWYVANMPEEDKEEVMERRQSGPGGQGGQMGGQTGGQTGGQSGPPEGGQGGQGRPDSTDTSQGGFGPQPTDGRSTTLIALGE